MILPETGLRDGALLAVRLRVAFADVDTVHKATHNISMTASFGVATVDFTNPNAEITRDRFIACADELLYQAKNAGRNLVKSQQLS